MLLLAKIFDTHSYIIVIVIVNIVVNVNIKFVTCKMLYELFNIHIAFFKLTQRSC